MSPALLAALALVQAEPSAPVGAGAPMATAQTAPAPETPSNAPADDFGFVNWCKGALSGHMELYDQVKPELARVAAEKAAEQDKKLSPAQAKTARTQRAKEAAEEAQGDRQQLAAGRTYLALYDRAIAAGEKAGGEDLLVRAQDAQSQGYRIWSAARAAPGRTKMWSWLMWELPARCETAAKTLETQSDLLGAAFQPAAAQPATAPADAPAAPPPPAASPQ